MQAGSRCGDGTSASSRLAARERRVQQLNRQLGSYGVEARLASIHTRLVGARGRLLAAMEGRRHRAVVQLGNSAGRLASLSPLAVLARGYAVAWNAERTRVLRDAAAVERGDTVHLTLSRGEVTCEVRERQISTAEDAEDTGGTRIN
jgi:exodeoxyribonuclease VII large subunit